MRRPHKMVKCLKNETVLDISLEFFCYMSENDGCFIGCCYNLELFQSH